MIFYKIIERILAFILILLLNLTSKTIYLSCTLNELLLIAVRVSKLISRGLI